MLHELLIRQEYLIHILEGKKTFEIRQNDRDFQTGDTIRFLPLDSKKYDVHGFSRGPIPDFMITYVHQGLGMESDYAALAIVPMKDEKKE